MDIVCGARNSFPQEMSDWGEVERAKPKGNGSAPKTSSVRWPKGPQKR